MNAQDFVLKQKSSSNVAHCTAYPAVNLNNTSSASMFVFHQRTYSWCISSPNLRASSTVKVSAYNSVPTDRTHTFFSHKTQSLSFTANTLDILACLWNDEIYSSFELHKLVRSHVSACNLGVLNGLLCHFTHCIIKIKCVAFNTLLPKWKRKPSR